MSKPSMSEVLPRGTLQRFGIAGGFNTFIFWIIWETLRLSPLYDAAGETELWSLSWLASSVVAHFVHRRFTFDGRRNVRTTVLGAISVYAVGMMGSTLSFDVMLDLLTTFPIRLLFLLNIGIWGLFTWASMRWFVFGYTTIEDE
ncbi:GtrA family protein [Candidatus Poseidoniales archaeon]|nr:GtrA family protein [Candidatus Poseidoniales archaeon]MDA8748026.1 GtrA family protein [Candidatus Poseidoniales archaeon]